MIVQTENTARHTKYGRIRMMVVGEGGRSTGVLLYRPRLGPVHMFSWPARYNPLPHCISVGWLSNPPGG